MNDKQETSRRDMAAAPSEKEITDYIMEQFDEVKRSNRIRNLVSFQTMNKYMIMSRDQEQLKVLGNIVARYQRGRIRETIKEYDVHLKKALAKSPTVRTHSNVILHIFGHFSKHLDQNEKKDLFRLLEQFKEGKSTVGRTLAEISSVVYRLNSTYLASQTYFLLYSDPRQGDVFSLLPK